jgi:subtilisin family serine protease
MKKQLNVLVMLTLTAVLLLATGCELTREEPDISGEVPSGGGTVVVPVSDTPTPEGEAPVTGPDPEVFSANVAPDIPPEAGKVMVKLEPQTALQARSAQPDSEGIMASGVSSFDETLKQLGAVTLEPVIEPVADGNNETLESLSQRVSTEINQIYTVNYTADIPPEEAAAMMSQDPSVEYAEPNFIAGMAGQPVYVPAPFVPNDPYYSYQWHFEQIQMPAAWDISTGQNVIVAVVDTGVDFSAPDLANTSRLPGYDFINNDGDPTDDQGHGTHVAGTIAQSTNNGVGVTGVAYNATLLPVKVLGNNGQGNYDTIIQGIIYAVDQGAKVINLSLAGRQGSQALEDAMRYANERGVIVVAAAGNSNGPVEFPAAYDNYVIAVGAVGFDKTRAPYSNFGPQIDLVAPGGNTKVDLNQDGYADGILQQTFKQPGKHTYLFFEGTSMASPHVAGLAALLLAESPNSSPAQIKDVMIKTARNVGAPNEYGAGLIQAADALVAIGGGPVEPPTDTPTPTETTIIPEPTTDTPTPTITPVTPEIPTDTPTPTETPIVVAPTDTPTPIPLPPGELLVNGGFETDEGWVFGDTPIRGGYDTSVILNGNRSARLGATSGRNVFSFSSVWQRVTIPADARQVVLSANVYPFTEDSSGADLQYIAILNSNFRLTHNLSLGLSDSRTWENKTYDISELRGQTIYVYFSVLNRGCSGLTAMYVDDVSLRWSQ